MLKETVDGSMVWETARLKRPTAARVTAANEGMAGEMMLRVLVNS